MDFQMDAWLEQGAIIGKVGQWVEVLWGEPRRRTHEKDLEGPSIYSSNFFHETPKPWYSYPHSHGGDWKEWKNLVRAHKKKSDEDPLLEWVEPAEKEFETVFKEIKAEIKSGRVVKAVPIVYNKARKVLAPALPILSAIQQSPKNTHVYGRWGQNEGFFGFSPEILFVRDKDLKIKTMALAGTRKKELYLQDPEDFLRDPKEIKEHQIVVDDITERLQALGKVKVAKTSFLELNYLVHLYTPIQVTPTEPQSFEKLIDVLHPTPALGISPRNQLQLLKKWRDPAELLGAPFGIRWSADRFLCLVAIRKIQWDENFYYIGSGCGVVSESKFDDEWQELKIKRDSVRKVFQI